MNVFVTIFDWGEGDEIRVFATKERAQQAKEEIADELWDEKLPQHAMPVNPKLRAIEYFAQTEQQFRILERPIIGLQTPPPK